MIARLSLGNVVPSMLTPKLEEVRLASCQLELPPRKGSKKNQPELDKELTQISKPGHDTVDQNSLINCFLSWI